MNGIISVLVEMILLLKEKGTKENAKSIPSMKRMKVVETDGITIVIAKICNHQQSKLATMILFSKIIIMNPTRLAHKFCTAAVIFF